MKDGDYITIDLNDNSIHINVDIKKGVKKELKLTGYLEKYSRLVGELEDGFLC